jgi:CII-binding regulator of phage lambda lysogenization HflD
VNQVTNVTNGIMSLLGVGVTQAQSLVQNYTAQATAVNAAAQGPLESLLQTAVNKTGEIVGNELQYKWNSTLCVVGQKENATSVVHQAGR